MALNTVLPHIPDLVIHHIIRLLPTKDVIRMSLLSKQWVDVLSSVPTLDFDDFQQQHEKLNNVLTKYLELCEKDEHKKLLEKFRLRMMYLSDDDKAIVDRLVSSSFKRVVKELEMSLRVSKSHWTRAGASNYYCFCLSPTTLANAKSLTTLKLEYMRIKEQDLQCDMKLPKSTTLLPSLKTMSLKNVHIEYLYYLFRECSSIEHLSLISCSFEQPVVLLFTSSLKSLEVKHCKARRSIVVQDEGNTLESFTFISTRMEAIVLSKTFNLKHINIHSQHLEGIFMHGCHTSVKAVINAPKLIHFDFFGYLMKSQFSVRAPQLSSARFILKEIWNNDQVTNNWSWEHFSALRVLLKQFGRCRDMYIYTRDYKALTFPEDFRRTFSALLPSLEKLTLIMPNPIIEDEDVLNGFMHSCTWMAPSSRVELVRSIKITGITHIGN